MTENQFMARLDGCERLADFERALYDRAEGRLSRTQCKMLVRKGLDLVKAESRSDAKELLFDLVSAKRDFFAKIAG